jgi:putative tricarboxylic transport membrane protein
VAVYLMQRFGFFYIAPVLALAVMLFIGERRPWWLLTGVIAAPALIWLIVEKLLERPLP